MMAGSPRPTARIMSSPGESVQSTSASSSHSSPEQPSSHEAVTDVEHVEAFTPPERKVSQPPLADTSCLSPNNSAQNTTASSSHSLPQEPSSHVAVMDVGHRASTSPARSVSQPALPDTSFNTDSVGTPQPNMNVSRPIQPGTNAHTMRTAQVQNRQPIMPRIQTLSSFSYPRLRPGFNGGLGHRERFGGPRYRHGQVPNPYPYHPYQRNSDQSYDSRRIRGDRGGSHHYWTR